MADDVNEHEHRARQQGIDLNRAQRRYVAATDAYLFGTKRIVAGARDEIAKLKMARDDARFDVQKERNYLDKFKADATLGFES